MKSAKSMELSKILCYNNNNNMKTLNKKSLFWDTQKVDPKKNEKFVIERILSLGEKDDFDWARKFYGEDRLKKYLLEGKNIDEKSLLFWCQYFKINPKKCTQNQLTMKQSAFWRR